MPLEIQKIVNKSLEIENDFSSSSHIVNVLMYESSEEACEEFTIPARYYENTLTLLAVNTQKYYVYWEIKQELLDFLHLNLHHQGLCFRVLDQDLAILCEFESPFDLGEHFFELDFEDKDICVQMGFLKENKFVEIMQSNSLRTFSHTIKLPDLSNEIWLEKYRNFAKIIQSTIENREYSESSSSLIKKIEQLYYLNNSVERRVTSTSMLGRKK